MSDTPEKKVRVWSIELSHENGMKVFGESCNRIQVIALEDVQAEIEKLKAERDEYREALDQVRKSTLVDKADGPELRAQVACVHNICGNVLAKWEEKP